MTTTLAGVPNGVLIDLVALENTVTDGDHRTYVGTVDDKLWQIDLFGTGSGMTATAIGGA